VAVICVLAGIDRGRAADKPPTADSLTVVRDIRYREGPSKQWRLDLAVKKAPGGKPRPAIVVIHGEAVRMLTGSDSFLHDRGREDRLVPVPPPSEPDGRFSRIRLSG